MGGMRRAGLMGHLVRFAMSSGLSAMLSFALPVMLHEFLLVPVRVSVAIGFATSYLLNFLMLRSFVFRSANSLRGDASKYLVVNGAFRLAEYFAFLGLNEGIGIDYAAAVLIVLTLSTIMKFFGYRRLFSIRAQL